MPNNQNTELIERIKSLTGQLNRASEAYYGGRDEIMSNYEWDAMFDELSRLEQETGFALPESPTQNTGMQPGGGNREPHEFPALSLAKTKQVEELQKWAGDKEVWLSWKLDGLTLVLTYDEGKLARIVTRGNGTVGKNITFLKHAIKGFPLEIPYSGHMVVRGEAVISYSDFEMLNDLIEDEDERYANPRNLASGTLNLEDEKEVAARRVHFYAFALVFRQDEILSHGKRLDTLEAYGFTVVDREKTDAASLPGVIAAWTKKVESGKLDLPVDGLVIGYEDEAYAATGSVTGHHATRAGLAFKWQDEAADTRLRYIEWSCAVSTISPVAVFEPVQIEGTTVSRASLCNISEIERLGVGKSCTLSVIKANKIIPKCIGVKDAAGEPEIPSECPVCHAKTEIRVSANSGTKTLHCTNPDCIAKQVRKFTRFVSKSAMDMDGLSIRTLLTFMNAGFLSGYADLYHLDRYFTQLKDMDGFGEKSCENLAKAIEKSRRVHPVNFIYALCIPMIGTDAAKKLVKTLGFEGFLQRMEQGESFEDIDGIGEEKSRSILNWYQNPANQKSLRQLLCEVTIEKVEQTVTEEKCKGLTFVITGDVHTFANRDAFKAYVESQGGKVAGSVSKKTDYLVNNDAESASSKNRKAKELGIPIISEDTFLERFR